MSAQTLPASGMTCGGRLYALPMSERPTSAAGSTSSRLFPTPWASDGEKGGPNQRGSSGDLTLPSVVVKLFPTPTAKDGKGNNQRADDTCLPGVIRKLFPTPRASDANGAGEHGNGGLDLRTVVSRLDGWDEYEPAVRHWEAVFGRYAPEPTTAGRGAVRVLNPAFVEWMMGLPEGLVSGRADIPRTKQIRLLGNGVVPQQAELAIRQLLNLSASAQCA